MSGEPGAVDHVDDDADRAYAEDAADRQPVMAGAEEQQFAGRVDAAPDVVGIHGGDVAMAFD
jgi:hypothetical protein